MDLITFFEYLIFFNISSNFRVNLRLDIRICRLTPYFYIKCKYHFSISIHAIPPSLEPNYQHSSSYFFLHSFVLFEVCVCTSSSESWTNHRVTGFLNSTGGQMFFWTLMAVPDTSMQIAFTTSIILTDVKHCWTARKLVNHHHNTFIILFEIFEEITIQSLWKKKHGSSFLKNSTFQNHKTTICPKNQYQIMTHAANFFSFLY